MQYNWNNFANLGFVSQKFTDEELAPVKEEISLIQKDFSKADGFQYGLAGHIQNEYKLTKSFNCLEKLIYPLLQAYNQEYPIYYGNMQNTTDVVTPIVLGKAWVNFQKKLEFNPHHDHSGLFSFVLWINIPYDIEEERKVFPQFIDTGRDSKTSCFEFIYTDASGRVRPHILHVDKNYEGMCVLFPSSISHQVYPFYTSDGYRISVSGNLYLKGFE